MKSAEPVVPRIRATAFVIHTNILPDNKAFIHLIVLAGGKVRLGDETDHWRLFDLDKETVTFVDDVSKTYRTVSAATLIGERLGLVSTPAPYSVPTARYTDTNIERTLFGYRARQHVIEAGPYRREIWLSPSTPIGDRFFAMMIASEPISDAYAAMMKEPMRALVTLKGFPVLDRSDMPYDGKTLTVERRLERIETRNVSIHFLTIPVGYRNLTPDVLVQRNR